MNKKVMKIGLSIILTVACVTLSSGSAMAAKNTSISNKTKTVKVGSTTTIKVLGASKKVTWKSSNNKVVKITKVTGNRKQKASIKGVKTGTATVTAKVGNKTLKCKVTVKKASMGSSVSNVYITETGSKYHISSCPTLKKSKIKISLISAKSQGYEPCKICHK